MDLDLKLQTLGRETRGIMPGFLALNYEIQRPKFQTIGRETKGIMPGSYAFNFEIQRHNKIFKKIIGLRNLYDGPK